MKNSILILAFALNIMIWINPLPRMINLLFIANTSRAGGPILEPMCGTGNFLLPYTKEGFPIEGYDGSEAMLKVLERKSQEESLQVSSWQQLTDKSTKKESLPLDFYSLGVTGSFN